MSYLWNNSNNVNDLVELQLFHNLTKTTQHHGQTYTGLQLLLNKYITLFSEKPPKGFGKFFGERSSAPPPKQSDSESKPSESSEPPREQPNRPKRSEKVFEFKSSFGGNQGSDGKKGGDKGNPDREKWFTFGMIGAAVVIAITSYYGYSYQEITWKDLTRYINTCRLVAYFEC